MANNSTVDDGEIVVKDKHTLETRHKMMDRLKWNSTLISIGRIATFIAGTLMAAALGIIGSSLKNIGTVGEAFSAAASNPVGLTFLAVATVATGVAISADYAASRIWHSNSFDNLELNAQHVAENLVAKMKDQNMCITPQKEYEQNCRNDGRSWVSATNKEGIHRQMTQNAEAVENAPAIRANG